MSLISFTVVSATVLCPLFKAAFTQHKSSDAVPFFPSQVAQPDLLWIYLLCIGVSFQTRSSLGLQDLNHPSQSQPCFSFRVGLFFLFVCLSTCVQRQFCLLLFALSPEMKRLHKGAKLKLPRHRKSTAELAFWIHIFTCVGKSTFSPFWKSAG